MRDDYKVISKKLTCTVIVALCISGIVYWGIYNCGVDLLEEHFFYYSNKIYDSQQPYIEELSKYVSENNISVNDYKKISDWIRDKQFSHFQMEVEGKIVYDVSNMERLMLQTKELYDFRYTEPFMHTIQFADKEANVFIYTDYIDRYYIYLIRGDIVVSVFTCVLLIFLRIRKMIRDILGKLREAEKEEQKARVEKDSLMRNMAHDLRTPLTGLASFVDIIRLKYAEGEPIEEYIPVVEAKISELRALSDQIFDFSLASSEESIEMDEPLEAEYVIGDYLSGMYAIIAGKGYSVDIRKMKWEKVDISVNSGFMGRIFNNITDNICKYADVNKPVIIETSYPKGKAVVKISNSVCIEKKLLESAGIGLKNVSIMMDRMGGKMLYHLDNKDFYVTLEFPVSK